MDAPESPPGVYQTCPGYEAVPNPCRCPCYGCKHHCGAHSPEEAADRLSTQLEKLNDLYREWLSAGPPRLGASLSRWWDQRLKEFATALEEPSPLDTESWRNTP